MSALIMAARSSSATVNIITDMQKMDSERGRFRLNFIVSPKDKTGLFIKNNETEYDIEGAYSPDIELTLTDNRCDIQFFISGALTPRAELEKGEDIISYSPVSGDAKHKEISLKPTNDPTCDGTATIKFKVNGKVEHTAHIYDIPTQQNRSSSRSGTDSVNVSGRMQEYGLLGSEVLSLSPDEEHSSMRKMNDFGTSVNKQSHENNPKHDPKSEMKKRTSVSLSDGAQGCQIPKEYRCTYRQTSISSVGKTSRKVDERKRQNNLGVTGAIGISSEEIPPESLGKMNLAEPEDKSGSSDENYEETQERKENSSAFKIILSDKSLYTLASVLDVSQAHMLLTYIGISTETQRQHQRNHPHDVVSALHESFKQWRNQNTNGAADSKRYQELYEELVRELEQVSRNDIVTVVKKVLAQNRCLMRSDFK